VTIESDPRKVVVVAGDVTMDWNLAQAERSDDATMGWIAGGRTRTCWQRGGAALLADVVSATAAELRQAGLADYRVLENRAPRSMKDASPGDTCFHHSYSLWSLFPRGPGRSDSNRPPVWRVERFLDLDRCSETAVLEPDDWRLVVDDSPAADLVVLDDADLGFRDSPELWPKAITTEGQHPWVLQKMARPVAQGKLWQHLLQNHAERLVVVMTVNDLRLTEVQISRELSWERTAQDLAWELVYNPRVNALSHCALVAVSFDADGAFLLSRPRAAADPTSQPSVPRAQLIFDPTTIEGIWAQAYPGRMIGYTTCLAAGLARQLMLSPDQPEVERGIQHGLSAIRRLHQEGYGDRGSPDPQPPVVFPVSLVAAELARSTSPAPFAVVEVQDPVRFLRNGSAPGPAPAHGYWTILRDRYVGSLEQVARQIVEEGLEKALEGVPIGRFGKLTTVDRQEIESFRSIRALVGEYCRQDRPRRPLSIAVFGSPGSGKSFGVTEVASSLLPDQIKKLDFNLSQFTGPEQLLDAFHQVRDIVLAGLIPLVFWDEFDTALPGASGTLELGWLRHFLVPMQDGVFQEGQILHPIGRAIFVFAGGTSDRREAFDRGSADPAFRSAKGSDFVSRLRGYVDILGPNPQGGDPVADPHYLIRRAIQLRSLLQRDARHLFARGTLAADSGVLRAFLEIPRYKHGVRSMESLIAMSQLAGRGQYERSCLPAEEQLNLHVDGRHFLALVGQIELEGELLEKLAEAAHAVYASDLKALGRTAPYAAMSYAELPEEIKQQNRDLLRDIPSKLARIGCIMCPAHSNEPPFTFPGDALDTLSEAEHERYVQAKVEAGWRWGPETDAKAKLHKSLLPWRQQSDEERARRYSPTIAAAMGSEELPEEEKEKDRSMVRGIPSILARAGYAIERQHDEEARRS
jgi:hypothetical protein